MSPLTSKELFIWAAVAPNDEVVAAPFDTEEQVRQWAACSIDERYRPYRPVKFIPAHEPSPEYGDWLWRKLMGWCKQRGYAPASISDLFAIVSEARATQPPGVDNARLAWIGGGTLFDELCGVDIHEKAMSFADMAGRGEPNENDLANAARYVIDAAMAEDSSPTKGVDE